MASPDLYVRAQNGAVELAVRDLTTFWNGLELGDSIGARIALERFWPELLERYGDIAATLAADNFEVLTSMPATMVRPVDVERANARMRWAIDPLFTREGDALARMVLLTDELVKQPGRSTTIRSATENGIRFARVPSGIDTCTFCLMLASRGAVFASRQTAARAGLVAGKFHGDCNCTVEPVRNDAALERLEADGYDTKELYAKWQDKLADEQAARDAAKAKTP